MRTNDNISYGGCAWMSKEEEESVQFSEQSKEEQKAKENSN